jgi:hypothetical protein
MNGNGSDFAALERVGSGAPSDSVSSRGEKRRSGFFGLGGKKDKDKEREKESNQPSMMNQDVSINVHCMNKRNGPDMSHIRYEHGQLHSL